MRGAVIITLLLGLTLAAKANNERGDFSSRLFDEIRKSYAQENVIISPASIRTCLALAYMGAAGKTAAELHDNLALKGSTKDEVGQEFSDFMQKVNNKGVDMKSANRIYVADKYDVDAKYNELSEKYFKTKAEKVDFKAPETAAEINAWVATQTNDKIKQAVDSNALRKDVAALLVNAIYFKANWQYKFDETRTREKNFRMSKENIKPVKMMQQKLRLKYADLREIDATAVELPYDKTDISMLIILPNQVDGLDAVEAQLKNQTLTTLDFYTTKVNLELPKFRIEFGLSLAKMLENLGIKQMFSDGDFSSLSPNGALKQISDVNHKAFIEVDEHGTEAAAFTGIVGGPARPAPPEPTRDFIVDHPFFFAIKDDDTVYFAGHIKKF